MCGLFAYSTFDKTYKNEILSKLIELSKKRGQDNVGITFVKDTKITSIKNNYFSKKIKSSLFKKKLYEKNDLIFGQCRLVTDGPRYVSEFNQPLISKNLIGTHNGIATDYLKDSFSENLSSKNDSFQIYKDIEKLPNQNQKSIREFLNTKNGILNLVFYDLSKKILNIYTNNGSLYYIKNQNLFLLGSEKYFLEKLGKLLNIKISISKFELNEIYSFDPESFKLIKNFDNKNINLQSNYTHKIYDNLTNRKFNVSKLKRCKKCILPSTYPLIRFDNDGICNYCLDYKKQVFLGENKLEQKIGDKSKKILYGLSGGRDSSYGLHYLINEFGLKNIVTFTYDWGLTTDTARRNISIMCSKLGVENILRSADINYKRKCIRKNIYAWLKKPSLGMVPIFFVGDKPFLFFGKKLRIETNSDLTIFGTGQQIEQMEFKTAYCNVNQKYKDNPRLYDTSVINKLKLFLWYSKEFILNPSYINESMYDNFIGFYSSFIHKDDALHLYNYIKYDKNEINNILKNHYNFFEDKTYGENQWRVGDGQTAFTNFIYYNIGGFSEFDNYLSNEIREDLISRDKALELAKKQNEVRIENIDHFCRIIGINTEEVLLRILNIKPLYQLD